MALHPTGLGKGLDALIRQTQEERDTGGVKTLSLSDIVPNPRQPRREFNEKALEELAASIKSQGLLQPLLVRPLGPSSPDKYEIVAGERRWRASQMAGLKEVPVLIRALSAQDTLAAALIENLQREDLNPLEEALGLQALKEEFGLSQDDMAHKLGKSRSAIANSLRLLSLPESMRPLLADGKLSPGHARALLSISDPKAQEYLKNIILENRLSVREAEGLAAGWKERGTFEVGGLEALHVGVAPRKEEAEQDGASAPPRQKRPQSARILDIQNKISSLLDIPVRVTGKESKGKITLSFNSKAELKALLERLAGAALEGASWDALSGASYSPLEGASHAELPADRKEMLDGSDAMALDGAAHEMLEGADRDKLDASVRTGLQGRENAALTGAAHTPLEGSDMQALTGEARTAIGAADSTANDTANDTADSGEAPAAHEDETGGQQ